MHRYPREGGYDGRERKQFLTEPAHATILFLQYSVPSESWASKPMHALETCLFSKLTGPEFKPWSVMWDLASSASKVPNWHGIGWSTYSFLLSVWKSWFHFCLKIIFEHSLFPKPWKLLPNTVAHKYHALLKTLLYFERNYFFHLKNPPLSLSLVNLTQLGYLLFLGLTQYFVDTQICCLCGVTSLALPWLCPKHLTTDSQEALSTRLMNDKICSMHKISETLLQL